MTAFFITAMRRFAEAMVLFMTVVMVLLILTMDEHRFIGWARYLPEPR